MKAKKVLPKKLADRPRKFTARLRAVAGHHPSEASDEKKEETLDPGSFLDARGASYEPGMVGWVRPSAPRA